MGAIVDYYDVDGLTLDEVEKNWSTYPLSYNLASWFCREQPYTPTAAHNWHETRQGKHYDIGHHQQGSIGLVVLGEIRQYIQSSSPDYWHLRKWISWWVFENHAHVTQVVVAHDLGWPKFKGLETIYQ